MHCLYCLCTSGFAVGTDWGGCGTHTNDHDLTELCSAWLWCHIKTPLHETVSEMHSSCWRTTPWHRLSSLCVEDGEAPRNAYWTNALLRKQIIMGVDWCWQDYSYIQGGIPCQKPSAASPLLHTLQGTSSCLALCIAKVEVCFWAK